jgi:hypothetical protein
MPDQPNPGTGKAMDDMRCAEVEPLFAEYLDGTLSADAQARLEAHLATCAACTDALAEVRRGLGWLRLLRADTLPTEPPAGLLEKIIARTSDGGGAATTTSATGVVTAAAKPSAWSSVNLAAVRSGVRRTGLWEPRLALTAAMAFFSISVTLSVAGIRPVDLKPTNLRRTVTRTYFDANARVTRYYENMRVVYELESRVRELRRAAETSNRPAPSNQPQQQPKPKTTPQSDSTRHPSAVDDGLARKDGKSGQQQKKADPKESEPEPVFDGDVIEARLNLPAQRPVSGRTAFSDTTLSPSTEIESLTVVPQRSMA